ncbi:hypothetical protein GLOIN_2v1770388 [Rhizophagus irregularis DAOM 181602=DAOM 197198]|uniref:Uncharacterized protein n=1 Tax=Rhizophagus irregularis (strain DAOM 181602 / DAOM 197198 / MUCL 43194) TaxID=747089 RepID=A0A2P4QCG4_RHIID|nr:hypothetical protein GLOIN_2v1770388 [Rhizophagus irregularis DAOM 181602=DAOM 197198]POG75330.1 hypothetical protein GLOIN_2v1770388 [Rhizophagus irregularis DAOM 181602=DAOM 197198]GBC22561.2 hypothetical protein GLOIN_2v1770388 [Rhizophagus irregularis DAOM 181602=DAOM 197198]|eukprot:XP_025182196.1 hypothetical protein GLOIN_2v1770388 [Rhizophagus irregularis DAOM 181602=DAOM 197198]
MESNFAKFHINMIQRWYKEHLQLDLMKINNSPVVTLEISRKASQLAIEDGDELKDFLNKFIEKRKKIVRCKNQIGVNKNVRSAEINVKLFLKLMEDIEISEKRSGNISGKENANKKEYVCSKCKEIGHNARTFALSNNCVK